MLGLLVRVVIGVVTARAGGKAAYGVYKYITRDSARSEINEKIEDNDGFKNAFKAKVKSKKNESISFSVIDEWDEPLGVVDLDGDEISSDIEVGDVIILKEVC